MKKLTTSFTNLLVVCLLFWSFLSQAQTPATFNHDITLENTTITVNFTKYSVRGPNFQILEQQAGGNFNNITANYPDVRTYIGTIAGMPGAVAGAVLRDGGRAVQANVVFENGYQWFDQGGAVTDYDADTLVERNFPTFQLRNGGAGTTLYAAEIGVDISNGMINISGGSIDAAVEMAEFSILSANLPFIKDVSAVNQMGRLVIRADLNSDPYDMENLDILGNFPQPVTEDLLCLGSENVGLPSALGGLGNDGASLNNPHPNNGDFGGTARHEVGHNWGMGHQDGGFPEGKTISSGNELGKFSAPAIENMLRVRDENLGILDNLGTFNIPIPPRAADDIYFYEPGTGGNLTMNVLGNDRDVNGSAITILSFDNQTINGATITQNGNQLEIATPATFSVIPDRFSYRIQDADGMTSRAYVHLKADIPNDDIGHWTFEGSQNRVLDSGSKANHGQLYYNANINGNGELVLDGERDFVAVNPEGITTNAITYSAWVFSNQDQINETGIIIGDSYGLYLDENNLLAYKWEDLNYFSNLNLPNNTWTFLSLVVSANEATIYMQPTGQAMQTWVNNMAHIEEDMRFFLYFGSGNAADPDAEPPFLPYFNGRMDDIRIKNGALSAAQINGLTARGFGARNPSPYFTEAIAPGNVNLTWTPSPTATAQNLYFSSNYEEVKNGTAAALQMGITATTNTFALNNLNGSYYWRVESTESTGADPGCIWNFLASNTNHEGTCVGLNTVCNASGEVTGITNNGTDIFSVGTVGALEANFEFVQRNTPACGPPVQCDVPGVKGNRSPGAIAHSNGNIFVASGAVYGLTHGTSSACTSLWTAPYGGATGVTVFNNRLFVSEGDFIEELNPANGDYIDGWAGIGKVERLCPGPNGTIYFTNHQLTETGGVGVLDFGTGDATMLPAPAGTTLIRASGLTTDADGNIIVAERGKRRVLSIDPNTGAMTTLVDGFIDPTDVMYIGTTLYISDRTTGEVKQLESCTEAVCGGADITVTAASTGDQYASNTITTTGNITITTNTTYQAGTSITLNGGFGTALGAEFSALIGDCPAAFEGDMEVTEGAEKEENNAFTPLLPFDVFPNPTTGQLTFSFVLKEAGKVNMQLFDLNGKMVEVLVHDEKMAMGHYQISYRAALEEGMFFVVLQAEGKMEVRKVVVMK